MMTAANRSAGSLRRVRYLRKGTTIATVLNVLWARRGLLAAIAIVCGLISLPFALAGASRFTSSVDVLIPTSPPLPPAVVGNALAAGGATVVSARLDSYASGPLESDVKEALGEDAGSLEEVTAGQQIDQTTFRVTAEATDAGTAERAAEIGARRMIERGDAVAVSVVRRVQREVARAISPTVSRLARLRSREQRLASRAEALRQSRAGLTSQLSATRQERLRAEDSGDEARSASLGGEISELESRIDETDDRIGSLQGRIAQVRSDIAILDSRRASLAQLAQQTAAGRIARLASSTTLSGPTEASTGDSSRLVQVVGIGIATGLVVGAAILLLADRRRLRSPRDDAAESEGMVARTPERTAS
jgi:uncharacterized protein involved in exopolysaccharide biosynthesis